MKNKFSRDGSFINGCATGADQGWLAMVMDDVAAKGIDHTAMMSWARPLVSARFMKMFRTVFVGQLPDNTMIYVGDDGNCTAITAAGSASDEFVATGPASPANTGHIRSAAVMGDRVIAVGMQRQVFLRDPRGKWQEARNGLPPIGQGGTTGFEAVVAASDDEAYAAGWDGEIWRFDGATWHPCASPTNRIITALGVDADGVIFGCGRNGLIVRGRGDSWSTLDEFRCPDDLWAVAPHSGRVFLASLYRMYVIEDHSLSMLDFTAVNAATFGVLSSNRGQLWSIGEKDVLSYDGSAWSRVA